MGSCKFQDPGDEASEREVWSQKVFLETGAMAGQVQSNTGGVIIVNSVNLELSNLFKVEAGESGG